MSKIVRKILAAIGSTICVIVAIYSFAFGEYLIVLVGLAVAAFLIWFALKK